MTIAQSISAVLDGSGRNSDDYSVRKRFVYNELKNAYKELVRQDLNKYRLWDGSSSQTMECVELERVDAASCFNCESGIYILKSKKPLPDLLETDFGIALTGVYFLNGKSIERTSKLSLSRNKVTRYSKEPEVGYLLTNKHIHVVNYDDVDELLLNVEGFFEEPEIVYEYNRHNSDCDAEDLCKAIYEEDFGCPGHLLRRVIEMTRSVVFRKLGIPIDTNNNAKSDLNGQVSP